VIKLIIVVIVVDISDIDFFNFLHYQVQNFEILNHFKKDQNFVVNFWKDQKWNRKLMKNIKV